MGTGSNLPDPAAGTELLNAINTLVRRFSLLCRKVCRIWVSP